MTLRLLSYNIRFGGRGREQALAETIVAAAPDLVVFQEATDPVRDRTSLPKRRSFPFGPRDEITRSVFSVAQKSTITSGITRPARGIRFSRSFRLEARCAFLVCTSARDFPSGTSAGARARFARCSMGSNVIRTVFTF